MSRKLGKNEADRGNQLHGIVCCMTSTADNDCKLSSCSRRGNLDFKERMNSTVIDPLTKRNRCCSLIRSTQGNNPRIESIRLNEELFATWTNQMRMQTTSEVDFKKSLFNVWNEISKKNRLLLDSPSCYYT